MLIIGIISGILFMAAGLPIIQQIVTLIVTLLDYWSTTIAAKTVRINNQLDKEAAEAQIELQKKQMEDQERPPAIGFHVFDEAALYEEEE